MSKKTFLFYKIFTAFFLGILTAVSVNYGNWYLPVIAVVAGFFLLYALKGRVKEVMEDERDYKIAGDAARWAMTIYTAISVIAGLILYIACKNNSALFAVGNVLLYSACFLMYLYAILFKIFAKKDAGN